MVGTRSRSSLEPNRSGKRRQRVDRSRLAWHDSQSVGTINAEPEFRTTTGDWSYINYKSGNNAPPCEAERRKEICRQDQTVQFSRHMPRQVIRSSARR